MGNVISNIEYDLLLQKAKLSPNNMKVEFGGEP